MRSTESSVKTAMALPLVPAGFFGMVLGLGGLATAWRAAALLWSILPRSVGEMIGLAAVVVWAIVMVLYALKWMLAREQALAEAKHSVQCCFIGLAGISTMLVAVIALPHSTIAAWTFFVAGAAFTLLFALWRTGRLWRGSRDVTATTAVLYLPTVAGSFMTAIAASALGYSDWGELAFGAGFFSWLAIICTPQSDADSARNGCAAVRRWASSLRLRRSDAPRI